MLNDFKAHNIWVEIAITFPYNIQYTQNTQYENRWRVSLHTDQEGAEEDEGDKVEVGKVTSTLIPQSSCETITRPVTETRQHDLMPRLARRTPETHTRELSVNILDFSDSNIFCNLKAGLPEEKSQRLEKGLEVVVVIYCVLFNQFNVSKHLKRQESSWLLNAPTMKSQLRLQSSAHSSNSDHTHDIKATGSE